MSTSVIQGISNLDDSVTNSMELMTGVTSHTTNSGISGHSFVSGGNSGQTTMLDVTGTPIRQANGALTVSEKGAHTIAHEAGHYMGQTDTGRGLGLMNSGNGIMPTGADIRAIMQQQPPSGGLNTIIKKETEE